MSYLLAVLMIVIICAAQWFFTSRALRSPSHFIGWVSGGVAAQPAILPPCPYAARAPRNDPRIGAPRGIVGLIFFSRGGVGLPIGKGEVSVEAPDHTQ